MMDALRASYRDEAQELLAGLETSLLELEQAPCDQEIVSRVFRQMHTIKGSGAMFGFEKIATFTHEVESVLDMVRAGVQPVTQSLITLTLEARDYIKAMLEEEFGGPSADPKTGAKLLEFYRAFSDGVRVEARQAESPEGPQAPKPADPPATFAIRFRPPADVFLNGTNLIALLGALSELGDATITAQTSGIPELEAFDAERCYIFWDIVLTTAAGENAIRDVFVFVQDVSELTIEPLDLQSPEPAKPRRIGEILLARGDVAPGDLQEALSRQKRIGEVLVSEGKAEPDAVRSALSEQDHFARLRVEGRREAESTASVRVTASKLDSLVNTVGELVTVQARLGQLAAAAGDPELEFVAEEMERLTDRLRADTMSVRMLPIGNTFARFRRLVRDLSRDLGKQVELATEGGETELDKNVIEQLNDPLVHLIRNSIDHGIESPADRLASGKPAAGTIRLSATHSGAHVLIRIADDGAGLDRETILAKAVERGLAHPGAELTESEVFQFLFQPGFSTARQVTEVSGRGVGLDVVKRGISALRGAVEVRSRKGEGSTFILKLPLTLAIIDGLLVSVGSDYFVMPVSNILECVEIRREEIRRRGAQTVVVRDELIPYLPLRDYFGIAGEAPDICQVMFAETECGKFGFVVDRVIGDHQTVIKNLGRLYRNVQAVSGATILGDGAVALILDLEKLAKEAVEHA